MRNLFTLYLLIACVIPVGAQITLVRADFPVMDDMLRVTDTDATGLDLAATGADYTWDFSRLPARGQQIMEYKNALHTDYALLFLGLTYFGLKVEDIGIGGYGFTDIYNFYEIDNGKYAVKGIGMKFQNIPVAATYSKVDKLYSLPVRFNNKETNDFSFTVSLPSIGSYKSTGSRTTEVDGWGKITTPYGTFDCLRVKSVVTGTDSIISNIGGFNFGFGIPVEKVEYHWLAKGQKVPVFCVEGRMVAGNFVPVRTYYRGTEIHKPTVVSSDKTAQQWSAFPNPGKSGWQMSLPLSGCDWQLLIYDTKGSLVRQQQVTSGSWYVDMNGAQSGQYVAVLQKEKEQISKLLMLLP